MEYYTSNELYHHGILGQKWGIRRYQNRDGTYTNVGKKRRAYRSTGLGAMIARRKNAKIDKSFKDWKENTKKKEDAITKGIAASDAKLAYENDRSNKDLKRNYREANREYKKALRQNTTYRKGSVREAVGKDLSRKYLSEAKKIEKQLNNDPYNRDLQKRYNSYMSKHDTERYKAGRAQAVGAKRSYKKAAIKRGITMTVKGAVASAAVGAGIMAVNKYVLKGDMRLKVSAREVSDYAGTVKKMLGYLY